MKVLFIGGTGVISSACVELAVARGIEVILLNRGQTARPIPGGVTVLRGDIRDKETVHQLLKNVTFDVVVDWIAFTPDHIETDLELFRGRTKQFVFISSASAYQTPPVSLPITESTPLRNPYWAYSRAKIACEERLMAAYRQEGFPVTIVRPSHTYDATLLPMHGGYTVLHRMKQGKKVIVHGDGTSLRTLTHHRDFAKGFVGLLGNLHAIGEAVHITSDEVLTWNQIFEMVATAANVRVDMIHIPSELTASVGSRHLTRNGAPACWGTKRTAWFLTTPRSNVWCRISSRAFPFIRERKRSLPGMIAILPRRKWMRNWIN